MAASDAKYAPGDLVKISGIKMRPQLNGQIGVVKAFHEDQGRFEIVPTRGEGTLGLKPDNLSDTMFVKPNDEEFGTKRQFDNLVFWPSVKDGDKTVVPVHAFPDLPKIGYGDWKKQDDYIYKALKWRSVDHVGGIEEEGRAKATFLLLFDGTDDTSPINESAQAIVKLLPKYQVRKTVLGDGRPVRGACMLSYSPTKSTVSNGGSTNVNVKMESSPDRLFTHQQLSNILEFHTLKKAKAQYKAHDNPMHRVLGGL